VHADLVTNLRQHTTINDDPNTHNTTPWSKGMVADDVMSSSVFDKMSVRTIPPTGPQRISEATRAAMEVAAMRRGCVTMSLASGHRCRMYWGTCTPTSRWFVS